MTASMRATQIIIATLCALSVSKAWADDGDAGLTREAGLQLNFWVDSSDGDRLAFITPILVADIEIFESFAIKGDWGFAGVRADVDGEGDGTFKVGNPSMMGLYRMSLGIGDLRVGGGVALPVADAGSIEGAFAYAGGLIVNSYMQMWRWFPKTFSILVPADVSFDLGLIELSAFATGAIMIPTEGGGDKAELAIEFGGRFALDLGLVKLGLMLQGAALPTEEFSTGIVGESERLFQLSTEPFVRFDFALVYAQLGLRINLDEPLGPSFKRQQFGGVRNPWALNLGVGISI